MSSTPEGCEVSASGCSTELHSCLRGRGSNKLLEFSRACVGFEGDPPHAQRGRHCSWTLYAQMRSFT